MHYNRNLIFLFQNAIIVNTCFFLYRIAPSLPLSLHLHVVPKNLHFSLIKTSLLCPFILDHNLQPQLLFSSITPHPSVFFFFIFLDLLKWALTLHPMLEFTKTFFFSMDSTNLGFFCYSPIINRLETLMCPIP